MACRTTELGRHGWDAQASGAHGTAATGREKVPGLYYSQGHFAEPSREGKGERKGEKRERGQGPRPL